MVSCTEKYFCNNQPLQASTVVILHPGSTSMWLGRATDHLPHSIPHVIAWRKPLQCTADLPDQSLLVRDGLDHPDSETQKELALSVIEQAIWSRKASPGSRKHQTTVTQVREKPLHSLNTRVKIFRFPLIFQLC